jgi:hypothetical protein
MRFAKIVFRIAGIYGLLVLVPALFLESKYSHDYPPAVTHPEFYYGFFAVAIAWQILFLIFATDPLKYRPMIIPSILEKFGYPLALIFLHSQNRIDPRMFALGNIDWIFFVLFAIAYAKIRPT